jgi:hypothetical protein
LVVARKVSYEELMGEVVLLAVAPSLVPRVSDFAAEPVGFVPALPGPVTCPSALYVVSAKAPVTVTVQVLHPAALRTPFM